MKAKKKLKLFIQGLLGYNRKILFLSLWSFLFLVLASYPVNAQKAQGDWRFEDGTGSNMVKDYSQNQKNAEITNTDTVQWAWEDRYGWFLQFNNDKQGITVKEPVALQNDFTLDIRFSCDFDKIKANGASLLCQGKLPSPDFAVMVSSKGQVIFQGKGIRPARIIVDAKLEPNRSYAVAIRFSGNSISFFKDGKLLKKVAVSGSLAASSKALVFGGQPQAPFTGYLYMIRIFNSALPLKTISGWSGNQKPEKQGEAVLEKGVLQTSKNLSYRNPAATVLHDFTVMEPSGSVSKSNDMNKWFFRNFAACPEVSEYILQIGPGVLPDISYDPKLKGRYNLYIGMRRVSTTTEVQIKTSSMKKWATITLPSNEKVHSNYDILWAANVKMDGEKITLRVSNPILYLIYISFVPVDKDQNKPEISAAVSYQDAKWKFDTPEDSGCVERIYQDNKPMPLISYKSKKRGYVLWNTSWMDLIFNCSKPVKDPGSIKLNCFAAKGEFEPVAFALRSLKKINKLSLTMASPLKNRQGKVFKGGIDIRQTRLLAKHTTSITGKGEYMKMPTYLEAFTECSMPANSTKQFWVTINVPADTMPGNYSGSLKIAADGTSQIIPFKLTVYPFSLSSLKGYNFGTFYQKAQDDAKVWRKYFKDMKDHGMNSLGIFDTLSEIKVQKTASGYKVGLEQSKQGRMIKEFKKSGMDGDFLMCWGEDTVQHYYKKLPREEGDKAYKAVIREILKATKEYGWPRVIFQPYDEVPSRTHYFPPLIRELKLIKEVGGITESDHLWLKTNRGAKIQKAIDQAAPYTDIFSLRYSGRPIFYVDTWESILKQVKKAGKQLYTYNINNGLAISEMATMRFSTGWFFRTVGDGCTGYYLYAYQHIHGNEYNDFERFTDWVQQYPASAKYKTSGGPALYWEATREGIDDFKYILTLESYIKRYKGKAECAKVIAEAQELLKGLKKSFDIAQMNKKCVFLECKWDIAKTNADGKRIAGGRFNLPNGWTFEKYDEARRQIANMIIKIIIAAKEDKNKGFK